MAMWGCRNQAFFPYRERALEQSFSFGILGLVFEDQAEVLSIVHGLDLPGRRSLSNGQRALHAGPASEDYLLMPQVRG